MASALAWLAAVPGFGPQAAVLQAGLAPAQFQALKLWLISLLDTWGRLMYLGWVFPQQAGPGASGLLVTATVRELLYGACAACITCGVPDSQLLGACKLWKLATRGAHRLARLSI